jgi:hypothetical protein
MPPHPVAAVRHPDGAGGDPDAGASERAPNGVSPIIWRQVMRAQAAERRAAERSSDLHRELMAALDHVDACREAGDVEALEQARSSARALSKQCVMASAQHRRARRRLRQACDVLAFGALHVVRTDAPAPCSQSHARRPARMTVARRCERGRGVARPPRGRSRRGSPSRLADSEPPGRRLARDRGRR